MNMSAEVAPIAQLAEGSARMQEVSGLNPRLGGLGVSPFQASGGIGTLQSRDCGLQSTTLGNFIRTTKRLLRVKQQAVFSTQAFLDSVLQEYSPFSQPLCERVSEPTRRSVGPLPAAAPRRLRAGIAMAARRPGRRT